MAGRSSQPPSGALRPPALPCGGELPGASSSWRAGVVTGWSAARRVPSASPTSAPLAPRLPRTGWGGRRRCLRPLRGVGRCERPVSPLRSALGRGDTQTDPMTDRRRRGDARAPARRAADWSCPSRWGGGCATEYIGRSYGLLGDLGQVTAFSGPPFHSLGEKRGRQGAPAH